MVKDNHPNPKAAIVICYLIFNIHFVSASLQRCRNFQSEEKWNWSLWLVQRLHRLNTLCPDRRQARDKMLLTSEKAVNIAYMLTRFFSFFKLSVLVTKISRFCLNCAQSEKTKQKTLDSAQNRITTPPRGESKM